MLEEGVLDCFVSCGPTCLACLMTALLQLLWLPRTAEGQVDSVDCSLVTEGMRAG